MGKGKGPEKGRNMKNWYAGHAEINWSDKKPTPTPIEKLRVAAKEFVELNGEALLKASQGLNE